MRTANSCVFFFFGVYGVVVGGVVAQPYCVCVFVDLFVELVFAGHAREYNSYRYWLRL